MLEADKEFYEFMKDKDGKIIGKKDIRDLNKI